MIVFNDISEEQFLTEYWQKKPLLIKQAVPNFISPIKPNDLADMSLEDHIETRIVSGSIADQKWQLNFGPFGESTYANLPDNDWTLLVQGVDRFVDEVYELIKKFDFIPRWKFDDVMISYAVKGGSVGPHFDYYDVFLLQGTGKRRWNISTKNCNDNNYINNLPLKIMNTFESEQVFDVEPGDILYVPPKVAHHGVSLDNNCTTLSFGYRSYSNKELIESTDDIESNIDLTGYYADPIWRNENTPALIPISAINQAKKLVNISKDEFARFVTKPDILDQQAIQNFEFQMFDEVFDDSATYNLLPGCRTAYTITNKKVTLYINGEKVNTNNIDNESILSFCNARNIDCKNNNKLSISLAKKLFRMSILDKAI
jgi:50S ribosomal protein L16 3-hydroxylase